MQTNEFEKQVQERMGQIKFTPSDAVWANVEKKLQQRRKRRAVAVWFFLSFIIAGGAAVAILYMLPGQNEIVNHLSPQQEQQIKKEIPSTINNNDQGNAQSSHPKNNVTAVDRKKLDQQKNINDASATEYLTSTNIPSQGNKVEVANTKNQKDKKQLIASTNKNASRNKISNRNNTTKSVVGAEVAAANTVKPGKEISSNNPANEPAGATVDKNNYTSIDSSSHSNDSVTNLVKNTPVDSISTSAPVVKLKTTKAKWQFGMSAGFGMSDVVNIATGQKSYASYAVNVSSPGSTAQNQAQYISPSELNAGPAFSLGFVAAKKLKKRMSISVGLQYHYYSTSIKVGPHLDSASAANNSNFYLAAGPRVNDHNNKYHFVELPVSMEFQLLKTKPLQFITGISLGQLIASDVLTYDKSLGVYHTDKSNLNKTQLNLHLGLSWTLAQKSRTPVQLGPDFTYGLSNLSGKSVDGSNHLYSLGVAARVSIHKK